MAETVNVAKGCERKARFATRAEAEQRAKPRGQAVYVCQFCGGFHCSKGINKARVELERAHKALVELQRKGVAGPLLDAAQRLVSEKHAEVKAMMERR